MGLFVFILLVLLMAHKKLEIQELIDENYVPSSIERKKTVLMYFFVWIVVWLSGGSLSVYEFYHLKQSLGRWMLFFVTLIFASLFIFVWYLRIIPVLLFLIYIVIWVYFVKQAREWRYVSDSWHMILPFFWWIWNRVSQVFELTSIRD